VLNDTVTYQIVTFPCAFDTKTYLFLTIFSDENKKKSSFVMLVLDVTFKAARIMRHDKKI